MFVRSTVMDLPPRKVAEGIAHVRDQALPVVLGHAGCLGFSMLVERRTGHVVTSSAWGTRAAMDASRDALAQTRAQAAALLLATTPVVEQWEVADLLRARDIEPGFAHRSTRLEFDPGDAEQVVEIYRSVTAPVLAALDGFSCASLLIDLDARSGLAQVTFVDRRTMQDSRRAAAEIRRSTAAASDARTVDVLECDVVVAESRLPRSVVALPAEELSRPGGR